MDALQNHEQPASADSEDFALRQHNASVEGGARLGPDHPPCISTSGQEKEFDKDLNACQTAFQLSRKTSTSPNSLLALNPNSPLERSPTTSADLRQFSNANPAQMENLSVFNKADFSLNEPGLTESSHVYNEFSKDHGSSRFNPKRGILSNHEESERPKKSNRSQRKRSANVNELVFWKILDPDDPIDSKIRVWLDQRKLIFYDCSCKGRKPVQDLGKIRKHVSSHTVSVYECAICHRRFDKHLQLNGHMKVHRIK